MSIAPLATVILDPPTALVFGCALALVSGPLLLRAPERELPRTAWFAAGWGVVYALCVGWFYFERADWMFAYIKDAKEISLLPSFIVFLLILVAHCAIGALAVGWLMSRRRRGIAYLATLGSVLTLASVFWLQWKQYFLVGDFAAYHSGTAIPITSDPTMQKMMNLVGILTFGSAFAVFALRFLQGRRMNSPTSPSAAVR